MTNKRKERYIETLTTTSNRLRRLKEELTNDASEATSLLEAYVDACLMDLDRLTAQLQKSVKKLERQPLRLFFDD